jgi:hypothetical protein|tara:strand:+ start:8719 stop:8946 length:228 start_codon:yes stop_codon:yes gene_type:complete
MFNPLLDLTNKNLEELQEMKRNVITKLQQAGIARSGAVNQMHITLDTIDDAINERLRKNAKDEDEQDTYDELIST